MQSYLYVSEDRKTREEAALDFVKRYSSNFDIHIYDAQDEAGIDLIREIQIKLATLPVNSEYNSLVINNADLLTLPAQNALLKFLEEPPTHTIIILTLSNPQLLLPTVVSRTLEVNLNQSTSLGARYLDLVRNLDKLDVSELLKITENLDLNDWLISLKLGLEEAIANRDNDKSKFLIKVAQKNFEVLKMGQSNINKKILNESLVLIT